MPLSILNCFCNVPHLKRKAPPRPSPTQARIANRTTRIGSVPLSAAGTHRLITPFLQSRPIILARPIRDLRRLRPLSLLLMKCNCPKLRPGGFAGLSDPQGVSLRGCLQQLDRGRLENRASRDYLLLVRQGLARRAQVWWALRPLLDDLEGFAVQYREPRAYASSFPNDFLDLGLPWRQVTCNRGRLARLLKELRYKKTYRPTARQRGKGSIPAILPSLYPDNRSES